MNSPGWRSNQDLWRGLLEMEREVNQILGGLSATESASFPPVNIFIDREGATVTAEMPGVDPEDLDISVLGSMLTIRGERRRLDDEDNGRWLRQERVFGHFSRGIDLSFTIEPDSVEASYRHGVLQIRLKRTEADKPRQIVVQS